MPWKGLQIARAWQSTAIAVAIGLLAPLLILTAPRIESLAGRQKGAADHAGAVENLFDKLDTAVYDYLFQVRGPHTTRTDELGRPAPGLSEVVIVAKGENDTATINALYGRVSSNGQPYPRRVIADLIRKLKRAGAVVIGIDLEFGTPSGYNRSATITNDDQKFAAALKDCGNVVLAANFSRSSAQSLEYVARSEDFPIAELRHAARAVAPANVSRDSLDGVVRRFWLTLDGPDDPDLPIGSKAYPTFAPMIAGLYWKYRAGAPDPTEEIINRNIGEALAAQLGSGEFLNGAIFFHPLDSQTGVGDARTVNICYAGYPGPNTCTTLNMGDVLDPKNTGNLAAWFRDKIVLIGSTSFADQDHYTTPLARRGADNSSIGVAGVQQRSEAGQRYGVEIHANIIHTLIHRHYYREFDRIRLAALVWICGLVTALLVARLRPVVALVPITVMLAIIAAFIVVAFKYYTGSNFVFIRPVQIVLSTILAYGLESVYFYAVEDRRARRARNTFQRYVGPKVMERVLDTDFKPGTVEERHLTIMFTDVQGFTSLSEKMSPKEVVETFNRYLNEMVEIIDRHGGTLDKIMGDGVMAYFNAPLPLANHELKAVECALEMQAAMRSWRELSEGFGLPPLKVRIGINSGDVVFGEVGARRQLGYTVIGDAVNAAARLEPLNKEFGTEILISEAVLNKLDNTIEAHYVGELAIRGREEGIRAYSVTGHINGA